MGTRRKSRELALHALYQGEMTAASPVDTFPRLCDNFEVSRKAMPYAEELVAGIMANREAIDRHIQAAAAHWRVERMSVIDRNIMRIAVYELCFRDDVPASVAINEAIEVAKRYSADDSPAFINGILDAIQKAAGGKQWQLNPADKPQA